MIFGFCVRALGVSTSAALRQAIKLIRGVGSPYETRNHFHDTFHWFALSEISAQCRSAQCRSAHEVSALFSDHQTPRSLRARFCRFQLLYQLAEPAYR